MLELWAARLDRSLTDIETEKLLRILPSERRGRLLQLRDQRWRREPLCAYALLQIALKEQYGWQELPQMDYSLHGKPFFPQYTKAQFSISHTDGAVLVAISDQEVGTDIEKIRPIRKSAMEKVAQTVSEEVFFQTWVRREARTKRVGNSIAEMMRSESALQAGEFYYPLETFHGYVAGVAASTGELPGLIHLYTMDEILNNT